MLASNTCKSLYLFLFLVLYISSCVGSEKSGFTDILTVSEREWLEQHKDQLYFSPDPYYAPFEFFDKNDNSTKGLANEYIGLIEKKLNISFRIIRSDSFYNILMLAKDKKVAIVNAVTETEERSKYLNFTQPYIEIKNVILVKKSFKGNLTLDSLYGKTISVVRGYAVTEYLSKKYPDFHYDIVSKDLSALLNVAYGVSDAAILDIATSSFLTNREGITDLRVAGDTGYPIKLAIGSRKDWPELNIILNKALMSISSLERSRIASNWISMSNHSILDNRIFRITAIFVIISIVMIIIIIFIWNRMLKNQVREKTLQISNELKQKDFLMNELEALNKKLNEAIDDHIKTNDELTVTYQTLQKREEQIRTISDNIQSGMIYQLVFAADGSRKFTYLSDFVKSLYGITPEEAIADVNLIYSRVHEDDLDRLIKEEEYAVKTVSTFKTEYRIRGSSGSISWISLVAIPKLFGDGLICFDGIGFDITEMKNAEQKIQSLLAEKELILKEVHHRMKNYMNNISGLISLQIEETMDPVTITALEDVGRRVSSMRLLYNKLYQSADYNHMAVNNYIPSLVDEILANFPNSCKVRINKEIDDFVLDAKRLQSLGIMINELLTNIMKYAFNERDDGIINISMKVNDNSVSLIIQDNGIGIPLSINFENSTGFGMQLVSMLTKQIGGSIRIEREKGTRFILEFDI